MTQDQVFVPTTRSQKGLKPFDPKREDLHGASVTEEVKKELYEALGDSPLGATLGFFSYLVHWFSAICYRCSNVTRLLDGPFTSCLTLPARRGTHRALTVSLLLLFARLTFMVMEDFAPKAIMFAPHQWSQIIISDIGIFLWLAALAVSVSTWGFATVFRIYIVPYFWYETSSVLL